MKNEVLVNHQGNEEVTLNFGKIYDASEGKKRFLCNSLTLSIETEERTRIKRITLTKTEVDELIKQLEEYRTRL